LEYHIYESMALKEGLRILTEARERFDLDGAVACHRQGYLAVGEIAVWVGTTAAHRGAAFAGTQYIIDQIKNRLPIWKKEFYRHHPPQWVGCCGLMEHLPALG
jgi:molybdopterin synthase catalytic subunit